MSDLHAAIMNMDPPEGPSDFGDHLDEQLDAAYKRGFRDARHAAAELASLAPAVPQWMPIETAPKDGSYFLAGNRHGVWVCHHQLVAISGYRFDDPWRSVMLNHWHIESKADRYEPATHWMPLPAAPSAKEPT